MQQITSQEIRKVILAFLDERLINNANYKSAQTKLEKAKQSGDQATINDSEQIIAELKTRFEFKNWMNDALTRRIFWIDIGTHLSKGIHSSSTASNVNYQALLKSSEQDYVSSATPLMLPLDCTGNAAALDIFALLNQDVQAGIKLLDLIIKDHPEVQAALSDDAQQAKIYLDNLKNIIMNDVTNPKSSELNKQLYWPNHTESYLSAKTDDYRLVTPLHPSSLAHLVYQKVQSRFSDENKTAMELKRKHSSELKPYFTFNDLAVVKLGGSNPQGVSQLVSSQGGRNFLLPSIPPKLKSNDFAALSKTQITIFNSSLRYYCRSNFKQLFNMIESTKNTVDERDSCKDALEKILAQIIKYAQHIQTTMPAGWSLDYDLNMSEKYWLDPKRADLDGETNFKETYQKEKWIEDLEDNFAFWINSILKEKFSDIAEDFADSEFREWLRTFRSAVKASKRKQQGVF